MILLLSPAKSLDTNPVTGKTFSSPSLITQANKLAKVLKKLGPEEISTLMSISNKLTEETYDRIQAFRIRNVEEYGKQAMYMFIGDVYRGLGVSDFTDEDDLLAQKLVRILPGLYGILRPLDIVQPYRLEMGTSLSTDRGSNLYQFWGDRITKSLQKDLYESGSDLVINLASQEYFSSIQTKKLKASVININFKEYKDDQLRFLSFNAKVARGLMTRYIIKNRISALDDIKGFNMDGYVYSEAHSDATSILFIR